MENKQHGFTLIELIVTLVIVGIVLGAGYMYMYGYLPNARLNSDAMKLASLLKMAQSKAMTKSSRYGVMFKCDDSSAKPASCNKWYACMFADDREDGSGWVCDGCDTCDDCSCGENPSDTDPDAEVKYQPFVAFRSDVQIFDCSPPNTASIDPDALNSMHTIIFDRKGFSYKHVVSAAPPLTTTGQLQDFQIFLKSEKASKVREIEVNKGGMIELLRLPQAGNITPELKANVAPCN